MRVEAKWAKPYVYSMHAWASHHRSALSIPAPEHILLWCLSLGDPGEWHGMFFLPSTKGRQAPWHKPKTKEPITRLANIAQLLSSLEWIMWFFLKNGSRGKKWHWFWAQKSIIQVSQKDRFIKKEIIPLPPKGKGWKGKSVHWFTVQQTRSTHNYFNPLTLSIWLVATLL